MSNETSPKERDEVAAPSELFEQARRDITAVEPAPFSDQAFKALQIHIDRFLIDLMRESWKVARRHLADTVSATHVDRASEHVIAEPKGRVARHSGAFGGLLLGVSLSNLITMAYYEAFPGMTVIIAASAGIVGAFLLALHIARG